MMIRVRLRSFSSQCRATFTGVLGALVLALPASPVAAADSTPAGAGQQWLDCSFGGQPLDSGRHASDLIAHAFLASRCHNYELLLVQSNASGLKSFKVEHWIGQQGERSSVRSLDTRASTGDEALTGVVRLLSSSSPIEQLVKRYSFSMLGHYRIADRDAIEIVARPLDGLRYAQRFWIDRASGLMLKREIQDADGQPLEIAEVVSLSHLGSYRGVAPVSAQSAGLTQGDLVGWLPHGFEPQRETMVTIQGEKMISRLYGDGLSSLSVFVGPWISEASLPFGLNRIGAEKAMVVHRGQAGSGYQIVVIGEVPDQVLLKVAQSVNTSSKMMHQG